MGSVRDEMRMKKIRIAPAYVEGAVSFEHGGGWLKPWRLAYRDRTLFYPEDGLVAAAELPSGVRLRFRTSAEALGVQVQPAGEERVFDLTSDGELLASATLGAGEDTVSFWDLAPRVRRYELWLPQTHPVVLGSLLVPELSAVERVPGSRFRWLAYGSSITQCVGARSPARTWPAIASRKHGANLVCLGYGGNCHLDPVVALMMRDMPAHLITLEVGINICGHASLSARTFQPALVGFVRIIRERQPEIPIGIVTPIICPAREQTPNAVGMSLEDYREQIRRGVELLRRAGDARLRLFEGADVIGAQDAASLVDGCHPGPAGYELMGERMAAKVLQPLLDDVKAGVPGRGAGR